MPVSDDQLFEAAESYLTGELEFDHLYAAAVEALPRLQEQPESPSARLAALVAAMEAEAHEFTAAENRARLRDFLAAYTAGRRG
jgi:hypothetical protein